MKTKSLLFSFLLLSIIIVLTRCNNKNDNTYQYQFRFITEEYKPLNYTEDGKLTGLAPELLKEICHRLIIPFDSEILPWDEGFALAQTDENAVLYSTILNAERKDLFKWAGPFASLDWLFYASSQNQITLNSLDDAKMAANIGVIQDYSIEQYLVGQGFTNLVYCNSNIEAFDKLLKGEIDLFPSDKITAEAALVSLDKSIYDVTGKLTIRTDLVYFAFNKNIPDAVVADFQREIDALKSNGTLKSLYQQFMQSPDAPEILQVYTEQYPPLTFRNSFGEITGFGTDIVNEIMKRNRSFSEIKLSLWSNGYELALNNPNFCLFTMDRTEIREGLFNWVGPIGTNTTYFYTKAGSGITISSIDDAKNLTVIGTVNSWFSDQYLRNQGFTNLVSDGDPAVMAEKLMAGEIDAFVCTSVTFPDILTSLGYQYNEVTPAFPLMASDYYIAFSKNTSETIVNQWQSALDASKTDGTYAAIYGKWFP
jgi:polar amino acid transport system substrate-binding protein